MIQYNFICFESRKMSIFLNQMAPQDTRPTSASWPQLVHDLCNVPSMYHPFMSTLTEKGLSLDSFIYSEGKVDSDHDIEYVITSFEGRVYIWKNKDGNVEETMIIPSEITRISRIEKLLYCEIELLTQSGDIEKSYRFSYNTSQEDLYFSVLSVLFSKPYAASLAQMAAMDTFNKDTVIESLAIMNLKKLCYLLGNHIEKHCYFTKDTVSAINQKKITSEHFYAKTDRGYCFIDLDTYFVTTTFFPNNSILNLSITTSKDEITLQVKTKTAITQIGLGDKATSINSLLTD